MTATLEDVNAEQKTEIETEFVTFFLNDHWHGIDITDIQEINKNIHLTPVFQTNECITGVVNLRGEVVTVIDIRILLGYELKDFPQTCRNIIINCGDEQIGILVDRVGDVAVVKNNDINPTPSSTNGSATKHISGVYQTDTKLLSILNIKDLIALENIEAEEQ